MFNKKSQSEEDKDVRLDLDKQEEKKEEGAALPETFGFETTEFVSFRINGKLFEGTTFVFETKEEGDARKKMLVERFGESIIK